MKLFQQGLFHLLLVVLFTAHLSGQTLLPVGSGIPSSYGIYSGTVVYNNEIYAADNTHIYKWNGSAWSSLNVVVDYAIMCMEVYNGELYVAGWFEHFNGTPVNRIIRYNGSVWQSVGGGVSIPPSQTGGVEKMAVYGSELIAVGGFIQAGSTPANHIAKWNGSTWTALGAGIAGLSSMPGVCTFNNSLYVASSYLIPPSTNVVYVMQWDGVNWNSIGSGQLTQQLVSCIGYNNELYVGQWISNGDNSSALVKWDGANWVDVETNLSDNSWTIPAAMYVFKGCLYLSGLISNIDGIPVSNVARYSGSTWTQVGSGVSDMGNFFAEMNNELYLSGDFITAGTYTVNNIVKVSAPPTCVSSAFETSEETGGEDLIGIYPNPSSNQLNISKSFTGDLRAGFKIFNSFGKMVKQGNSVPDRIGIEDLPEGVYLILVENNEKRKTQKFIKN